MSGGGPTGRRAPLRTVGRSLPPAAAAGLLWWAGRPTGARVVALGAVALLVVGLLTPRGAERFDHALARSARAVAAALGVGLCAASWALGVVPLWALSRLSGHDPLVDGWSSPGTAWRDLGGIDGRRRDAFRIGSVEPAPAPQARRRARLRSLGVAALLTVVVTALLGQVLRPDAEGPWLVHKGLPVERWSFPGEPWAAEVLRAPEGAVPVPGVVGWIPDDVSSRYVNVVGNARRTLEVEDPEVTVFLFGGSSVFGTGQRDDHTIASELVRQSAARGLRLRVVNRGVSGFVNWQEAAWLRRLVEAGDVPDLAVFLDGGNEGALAWDRIRDGYVDPGDRMTLAVSDEERTARAAHAERTGWRPPRDPGRLWVELVSSQYRDGVLESRRLAAANGFEVVHFWQPQLMTLPADRPRVRDLIESLGTSRAQMDRDARLLDRARRRSGVDPIDLTGIFDRVRRPVFYDFIHSNEAGARLIAGAMLEHLWPTLERLRGSG